MKKSKNAILTSFVLVSSLLITACGDDDKATNVADLAQYTSQGKTYLDQSQFKAAINSANNAITAYPDHLNGYLILAKVYNKLGQSNQSIEVLQAYQGDKNSEYYLLLLETYQRSQKIISANKLIADHSDELSKNESQFKLLKAKLLLLENDPEQALSLFKELQQTTNYESEGYIGEARIAAVNDDKENALKLLEEAVTFDSKNVEALILKGFLLLEKGDIESAESTFSFALTIIPSSDIFTPERINILRALTSILTSQGRSSEALLYSRVLTDEFPTATTINEYYASAQEYYKRKQLDSAKEELYKILKVDAQNKKASTMLGVILYTEGDINGAEKYLSGMIDPEVNSPQLTQIYAMTQLKLNQSNDVLSILDGVIDYEKRLDTLTLYTIAAISEKQFDKADIALARIEELFPESPKLPLLMSNYITAKTPDEPQKSLDVLKQGLAKNSSDLSLQTTYLKKLLEMKKVDEADAFVKQEASKKENSTGTRLLVANYYLYKKDFSAAELQFNNIINESEDDVQAYYGLAQSKQIQRDWKAALNQYNQIISLYPEQLRAYYGAVVSIEQQSINPLSVNTYLTKKYNPAILSLVLADYQYQHRKLAEADKLIKNAVELPVELKDKAEKLQQNISNERIVVAIKAQDFSTARELVLSQLQLTPKQPLFLMRLASIETLSGQYLEAEKVLIQIDSMMPDNYQVALLQSQLSLAKKDREGAEAVLKNAWEKSHQDQVALSLYQFYLVEDKQKANEFLQQWLVQAPTSTYANLNNAMVLQANGENDQAIVAYEKVLKVSPNELRSLNNAAWLYSQANDPKAEALARRAYKIAPNNPAVIDTYGWILYNLGEVEQAKPLIKKAIELLPDDPEVQKHWSAVSK